VPSGWQLWNGRIVYSGVILRKERRIITISKFDCCRLQDGNEGMNSYHPSYVSNGGQKMESGGRYV
jgi:hypothetical protein